MLTFRLSQKLNAKIKVGPLATLPPAPTPFADGSAQLFLADRVQYLLISHTRSLYSTLLHGRGVADDDAFIRRSLDALREASDDDGWGAIYERQIAPASRSIRFGKTINRT